MGTHQHDEDDANWWERLRGEDLQDGFVIYDTLNDKAWIESESPVDLEDIR